MYVSETTLFLQDLIAHNPQIIDDQKKGRALWWDKRPQSDDDRMRVSDSRVRQGAYVYQTKL